MLIVKKPERDGGWSFTVKMTGNEFAGLDAHAFEVLFTPTSMRGGHYPATSLLAVLTNSAYQIEKHQETQ
jgi:hypothetical protein